MTTKTGTDVYTLGIVSITADTSALSWIYSDRVFSISWREMPLSHSRIVKFRALQDSSSPVLHVSIRFRLWARTDGLQSYTISTWSIPISNRRISFYVIVRTKHSHTAAESRHHLRQSIDKLLNGKSCSIPRSDLSTLVLLHSKTSTTHRSSLLAITALQRLFLVWVGPFPVIFGVLDAFLSSSLQAMLCFKHTTIWSTWQWWRAFAGAGLIAI